MNETRKTGSAWRWADPVHAYPGYVHGCRYPALVVSLQGQVVSREACDRLAACFLESCPTWVKPEIGDQPALDMRQAVEWLLSGWQALQVAAGVPVYETGRLLELTGSQARCVVPTLQNSQRVLASVIQQSFELLSRPAADEGQPGKDRLRQAIEILARTRPGAPAGPWFVKTAPELGMPVQELPGGAFQYGVAARARWMDSTFTDVTPTLSARLARNKVWAAALLRQAGLPVPLHQLVGDVQSALKVAHWLGYPVVVKPADQDGGVGVAAGLETDAEVQQAFEKARTHSSQILVEKHVAGRDYRLTVFNGEMIWAIERVPGGITGDGTHTVAQLLERLNADPRRGSNAHSPLKILDLDDEARQLLRRQGLDERSVPAAGRFVRMRRAANVAVGGMPVAVFDQVHPDNVRLAVRAANILRLDMAGVDLLIPDIAISWRDSGAAICEVNGQPSLGQLTAAHLYAPVLRRLVPGSGRVPTVLIVGAVDPELWLDAVSSALAGRMMRVGVVGPRAVTVGAETITRGGAGSFAGGRMLALDRDVDAMVLAINDDECLHSGLPVDRCDALILAGTHRWTAGAASDLERRQWLHEMLLHLLPACDGVVLNWVESGSGADHLAAWTTARWHEFAGDAALAAAEAAGLAVACAAGRESSSESAANAAS